MNVGTSFRMCATISSAFGVDVHDDALPLVPLPQKPMKTSIIDVLPLPDVPAAWTEKPGLQSTGANVDSSRTDRSGAGVSSKTRSAAKIAARGSSGGAGST